MINTASLFDELEKIALNVQLIHEPGLLSTHGLAGKHVTNKTIMAENPGLAKTVNLKPGRDALFMAPKSEFRAMVGQHGDEAYKATRRHELTHYMRGKRGKMARVGTPGLRGLGTTAREELIAHVSALKGRSIPVQQGLARGIAPGTLASMRSAYPGQKLRNVAMGGKAGNLLRRVGRLFKR